MPLRFSRWCKLGKLIDLSGRKFGRLEVTNIHYSSNKKVYWKCLCDCGKIVDVHSSYLTCGDTKSCGCLSKDQAITTNTTHGGSKTKLYRIWNAIKYRCENVNGQDYKDYGARGISVCQEWRHDFAAFRDWALANGYKDGLSIDRINNNKGYSPINCRWADAYTQANNKRNNRWLEAGGEKMTISQWSRKIGRYDSNVRRSLKKNPKYLEELCAN